MTSNSSPCHWTQAKVPPDGALIKVEDGSEKSPLSGGPKVMPGYRKRASTLSVISEQSEKPHHEKSIDDSSKRMERRLSGTQQSPSRAVRPTCFKPVYVPAAKAGIIKALGENMKTKFRVDDPVLVFSGTHSSPTTPDQKHDQDQDESVRNIAIRGTDYLIVSEAMNHIFNLPESISLQVAIKLGDKGVQALAIVKQLEVHCRELIQKQNKEKPEKIKILSVFNEEMSLITLPIMRCLLQSDMDQVQMTGASTTNDDGMVWLKKNFPMVHVIQWNNDAYEQVLLERTKDACKGLLDIIISFDCSMRALLRGVNCLKEGGFLICTEDVPISVWKEIESAASRSKSKTCHRVNFRSAEILKELLDMIQQEKVSTPPMTSVKKSIVRESQTRARSYSTEE